MIYHRAQNAFYNPKVRYGGWGLQFCYNAGVEVAGGGLGWVGLILLSNWRGPAGCDGLF